MSRKKRCSEICISLCLGDTRNFDRRVLGEVPVASCLSAEKVQALVKSLKQACEQAEVIVV